MMIRERHRLHNPASRLLQHRGKVLRPSDRTKRDRPQPRSKHLQRSREDAASVAPSTSAPRSRSISQRACSPSHARIDVRVHLVLPHHQHVRALQRRAPRANFPPAATNPQDLPTSPEQYRRPAPAADAEIHHPANARLRTTTLRRSSAPPRNIPVRPTHTGTPVCSAIKPAHPQTAARRKLSPAPRAPCPTPRGHIPATAHPPSIPRRARASPAQSPLASFPRLPPTNSQR
jgi:hypothetical protein